MTTLAELTAHYDFAMSEMYWAFDRLQRAVPPPTLVERTKRVVVYRYQQKTIQQALILKLARLISAMRATKTLIDEGHTLEAGALQRVLDETAQDIALLAGPLTMGKYEAIHDEFLAYFWEEEFDNPDEPIKSTQKRGMVKRSKIQAYNARSFGLEDPSTMQAASNSLFKAFSGYIHGASEHILDVYDGHGFHLAGVKGAPVHDSAINGFVNYVYRSLIDTNMVAMALQDDVAIERLYKSVDMVAKATGL